MMFSKERFPRSKDLSFSKFGKWATTDIVKRVHNGHTYELHWYCRCECGRVEKFIQSGSLTRGSSKQCLLCRNDIIKEVNSTIDGDSQKSSEYHGLFISHYNMKNRCTRNKDKSYQYYGAKGVSVCDEWIDYMAFKKWSLNNGWKKGLVISRNGDTGNYEPSNCLWKTRTENNIEAHLGKPRKTRRLKKEDILKIRTRYDTYKNMADDFGIKAGSISGILGRRTYADI